MDVTERGIVACRFARAPPSVTGQYGEPALARLGMQHHYVKLRYRPPPPGHESPRRSASHELRDVIPRAPDARAELWQRKRSPNGACVKICDVIRKGPASAYGERREYQSWFPGANKYGDIAAFPSARTAAPRRSRRRALPLSRRSPARNRRSARISLRLPPPRCAPKAALCSLRRDGRLFRVMSD